MIRPLLRHCALLLLCAPMAAAQLPYLTAPPGTLRIELDGAFQPSLREYADGTLRRLGAPVGTGGALEEDLSARLAVLLGRPATTGSLGRLTADLMHQRSEGGVGLAVGVTSRLTASVRLPIVSVRTESRLQHDDAVTTLGLNPALGGDPTSETWLTGFASALDAVQARRDAGDYAGDPTTQALADQVLASGPIWRAALADLLVDAGRASLLLPLATSDDGVELLEQAAQYRDQFSGPLGVTAPAGVPALPTSGVSTTDFNALLVDPAGFGLAAPEDIPFVALGDVELGLTYAMAGSSDSLRRRWFAAWLIGGVTLPTGTPPRANRLRDQGTGDGQLDVRVGGAVEVGRGRIGVRAEGNFQVQLRGTREARVGGRDAFLLPASRVATLQWDPGDVLTLTARPFVRVADRLALVGSAAWSRRGEDRWSSTSGDETTAADVADMGVGTGATALRLGVGLSYAHDGSHVDGVQRVPVEAGLHLERLAWSGSGLVAQQLVTRMWFRVYKKLW
jgi:hypothetical protein